MEGRVKSGVSWNESLLAGGRPAGAITILRLHEYAWSDMMLRIMDQSPDNQVSQPEAAADPGPLFDRDIPCPSCEYNLRGIAEPRCPECGQAFDPAAVLAEHLRCSRPMPPLAWLIVNVLRHRERFWELPQVSFGRGLSLGAYLAIALMVAGLTVGVGVVACGMAGGDVLFGGEVISEIVVLAVLSFLLSLVYMTLCSVVFWRAGSRDSARDADVVVSNSLPWVLVALPLLAAFRALQVRTLPTEFGQLLSGAGQVVLAGVLLVVCVLWTRTVYAGALAVGPAKSGVALRCVLANPFWYILLLLIILWT